MKRWEILFAICGAILLLLGAHWIRQGELPRRTVLVPSGICHTPVTIFDPPPGVSPAGSIIVFHGLSANRRIMFYLGQDFAGHGIRAYLADLPGHGDNTDPFTFARAQLCAEAAVATLTSSGHLDPAKTVLLGHSMGGEIAVRMADQAPVAATIAISPAPMVMPHRMPSNLLVFSAQFDVWQLKNQATVLQTAAGGDRFASQDFAQERAFELVHIPLATHTSMLDDRAVAHRSELWAMEALFPQTDVKTLALNLDLSTYGTFGRGRLRLAGAIFGLIGIGMLLPLAIAMAAKAAGAPRTPTLEPEPNGKCRIGVLLGEEAIAAMIAVLLLTIGTPLRFIHLYAGDYLASEALIFAAILLLFHRAVAGRLFSLQVRPLLAAAALGVATFLAFGSWFNWEISDLWLNTPRWLRFSELLPVACVFCYAEEVVLGPLGSGKSRARRFCMFLALRFEIWLAVIVGFFVLASGEILLPILVMQFAAFSIAQRLATDALLRRTRSATASALFGAILASWFVAAVFPIT